MYTLIAISVFSIALVASLLILPIWKIAPAVMLLGTIMAAMGIAGAIWSRSIAQSIKKLFSDVEARQKEDRSNLSHDIRNKLAIIKTDIEIALMDNTPRDELRNTLSRIMAETDKINSRLNGT